MCVGQHHGGLFVCVSETGEVITGTPFDFSRLGHLFVSGTVNTLSLRDISLLFVEYRRLAAEHRAAHGWCEHCGSYYKFLRSPEADLRGDDVAFLVCAVHGLRLARGQTGCLPPLQLLGRRDESVQVDAGAMASGGVWASPMPV